MTGLDDRQKGFENKFALDEANLFKAEARACKLFGQWLGEKLGLDATASESYAIDVVGANLEEPGFDDVVRFVMPDIEKSDFAMTAEETLSKMEEFFVMAQEQIKNEA